MQRGLVSPSRTTLIASSHRAYAIAETTVRGDAPADPAKVYEAAHVVEQRLFWRFDMAVIASRPAATISAALFGRARRARTPCRSRAKPFEDTIRAAGVGVEASLRAFARAYDNAEAALKSPIPSAPPPKPETLKRFPTLQPIGDAAFDVLVARARKTARKYARHAGRRAGARR